MTAQAQFDKDYVSVRYHVVSGAMSLAEAQHWMRSRADKIVDEHIAARAKILGKRADRELEALLEREKLDKARDVKNGIKIEEEE